MGNLSFTENSAKEKALIIFTLLIDDAEVKIKKLKDVEVLKNIWELAFNKDDAALKKILKNRAKELKVSLEG